MNESENLVYAHSTILKIQAMWLVRYLVPMNILHSLAG